MHFRKRHALDTASQQRHPQSRGLGLHTKGRIYRAIGLYEVVIYVGQKLFDVFQSQYRQDTQFARQPLQAAALVQPQAAGKETHPPHAQKQPLEDRPFDHAPQGPLVPHRRRLGATYLVQVAVGYARGAGRLAGKAAQA